MFQHNMIGVPTRITGTAITTITSGNANLIGVLSCCSATATAGIMIYHGVTASSSACGIIVFPSGSSSMYIPVPVYCSGGLTVKIGAIHDPDMTLFWNPAGGGTTNSGTT